MSTRTAPTRSYARPRRRTSVRTARRRLGALLVVAALTAIAGVTVLPHLTDAVREITLPLAHEDIIREQSAEESLDPALVAGVIYQESRFRDQTSEAGAKGLMQITPETAHYIARLSGGTEFELADLGTPEVNISYGTYYLRYLLDRYGGDEVLALAAYNGGEGNVDRWVARARSADRRLEIERIPFPETRAYVKKVLEARELYRERYPVELGL